MSLDFNFFKLVTSPKAPYGPCRCLLCFFFGSLASPRRRCRARRSLAPKTVEALLHSISELHWEPHALISTLGLPNIKPETYLTSTRNLLYTNPKPTSYQLETLSPAPFPTAAPSLQRGRLDLPRRLCLPSTCRPIESAPQENATLRMLGRTQNRLS